MIDFNAIANKNLLEVLEPIVLYGETHIEGCVKCRQRAFLCQVCLNAHDLLFPFQLDKVYRCDGCGSLTHSKCHLQQLRQTGENKCGKCERIRRKRIRQQRMSEMSSVEYSSE
ncbi:putative zinc-RING and/or ribbon domain-containing protein [Ditylenchus destructor]|nr:putative zinc-RING and/or ribbon domain-containing protein [Ditylenchus destructor]